MKILIRSITDVITNSSDEAYIIKTQLTPENVKAKYFNALYRLGYGTEDRPRDSCCGIWDPNIHQAGEGNVVIDYSVMCNVDDFYSILTEIFGPDNVRSY